jgi:hypothetical protein
MGDDRESVRSMAQRLSNAVDEGGKVAGDAALAEIVRRDGRDVAVAALEELGRLVESERFELAEAEAEFEANKRFRDQAMRLFNACPETATLYEAARLMADRGDGFARGLMARFDSREHRLEEALVDAAAELHPGWRCNDDGTFTKFDDSAPAPPALVEWLYKNHPKRAREIENSVQ